MADPVATKPWWQSKTIWLNVIGMLELIFNFIPADVAIKAGILATLNAVLRIWFTDTGLTATGPAVPPAVVAGFLIVGGSIFSPMVSEAQTWEAKTLWEPDYTVGLITVKNNLEGEGITARLTPGIGIGIAYSEVSSTNGEDWDFTEWSVAVDPLYIERDESGSIFWVPGIKGTVFNDYLQVYLGYKIGSLSGETTFGDRMEVKFGTSITGLWSTATEAVGLTE